MKFQKGQSGNPAGRRPGTPDKRVQMRGAIEARKDELVAKTVELALAGDTVALRLCLERIVPALKSVDRSVVLPSLAGTLADQGRVVLQAAGEGRVTPDQAVTLMQAIAAQSRIVEVDELERRVAALEKRDGES